jgi:hypothetical protein
MRIPGEREDMMARAILVKARFIELQLKEHWSMKS